MTKTISGCAVLILTVAGMAFSGCGPDGENSAPVNNANVASDLPANGAPAAAQPSSKEDKYPYQILKDLAQVHLKYNSIEESLRLYELAIRNQTQQTGSVDADSLTGYGDALAKGGLKEKAAEAYTQALRIYEDHMRKGVKPELHNFVVERIAILYRVLGNEKEYTRWLGELRAGENIWQQQLELAAIHEQLQNFERAEPCYKRALELTAKEPASQAEVELRYAVMLAKANREKESEEKARAVIKAEAAKDEHKRQARRLLFEIYDKRGELDKLDFK